MISYLLNLTKYDHDFLDQQAALGIYYYRGRLPMTSDEMIQARRDYYDWKKSIAESEEDRRIEEPYKKAQERELAIYRQKREIDYQFSQRHFEMKEELEEIRRELANEHNYEERQFLREKEAFYEQQVRKMQRLI